MRHCFISGRFDRRGGSFCHRMAVRTARLTTASAISAQHHYRCEFESRESYSIQLNVMCVSNLREGSRFIYQSNWTPRYHRWLGTGHSIPLLTPYPLFQNVYNVLFFFHFHGLEICKTAIIYRFRIASVDWYA